MSDFGLAGDIECACLPCPAFPGGFIMQQLIARATEFVLGPTAGRLQGALAIVINPMVDTSLSDTVRRQGQEEGRAVISLHLSNHLSEAALNVFYGQLSASDTATFLCQTLLTPPDVDNHFAEAWTLLRTVIEVLTTTGHDLSMTLLAQALGDELGSLATEAFSRHAPHITEALQCVPVRYRHREAARLYRQEEATRLFRQEEAVRRPMALDTLADILLPPQAEPYQRALALLRPPLTYLCQRTMFGTGPSHFGRCPMRMVGSGQAILHIVLDDPEPDRNDLCHRLLRQRFELDSNFVIIPAVD